MPNKVVFEAPLRVSPFIKFSRWSFLLAGIWFGASRFRKLQHRENEERAYIEKMKPIWMEEKRKYMANKLREDMLYLAKETAAPIPPSFDQEYPMYENVNPVRAKGH